MSLIVTRLDFTRTIDIMLNLCEQHLPAAANDKHRNAVEDVIFCLNTAMNSINLNGAADLLNTRPATPLATATPAPALAPAPARDDTENDDTENDDIDLTGINLRVMNYIRTHPDCLREDIATACGSTVGSVSTVISGLRKAGYNIIGQGRPVNYRVEE